MRLTLLESDRSLLSSAEYAFLSILAHAGVVWLVLTTGGEGMKLPTDEREARVFFLLPPDRVDDQRRQTDIIQLGKIGGEIQGGPEFDAGEPVKVGARSYGVHREGNKSKLKGELPFGPPAFLGDTTFSVLEVDEMVERFEGSAAPVYPPELIAKGTEGQVQATYVVDTAGRVDTATIKVLQSDDPRFTASVRTALDGMRFRPAKRGGRTVRQLVEQRFKFKILPPAQTSAGQTS
jgi:TonB family protein